MSRLEQIALGVDQLLNAVLGGYADEAISARCYRLRARQPYMTLMRVIDGIFFWQPGHCKHSYESEVMRRQLPREYGDAVSATREGVQ